MKILVHMFRKAKYFNDQLNQFKNYILNYIFSQMFLYQNFIPNQYLQDLTSFNVTSF